MPRRFLRFLAPLWIIGVIFISFLPGKQKETIGTYTPYKDAAAGHLRWQHRAGHFFAFGVAALLLILLGRNRAERVGACMAVIALGVAIEIAQHVGNDMPMEWWDVRDDTLAAIAVLVFTSNDRLRLTLTRT